MPDNQHYGILIIGSGEAGKTLAWAIARGGGPTAVIERLRFNTRAVSAVRA